jgi:hypothetical protein
MFRYNDAAAIASKCSKAVTNISSVDFEDPNFMIRSGSVCRFTSC